MKRQLRLFWRDERGSQLLEFILVTPLIWMLFIFCFDQFTIMYNKQKLLAAAYEAGRIASVQPNTGLAQYHAASQGLKELDQAIGKKAARIDIFPQGRWRKGNHIEAKATLQFRLIASKDTVQHSASYYMMIENAEEP